MKKAICIIIISILSASGLFATNEVQSANIVGYIKTDLHGGGKYILLGANFIGIDGANITLKDFLGTNQLKSSNSPVTCDKVYLWSATNQQYVQYGIRTSDKQYYFTTNWGVNPQNPVLAPGTALFVQSYATELTNTITVLGGVPMDLAITNIIDGTNTAPYFFIANPYPVEVLVDDFINTSDGAKATSSPVTCDKIYIWDTNVQNYVQIGLKSTGGNRWYYTGLWTSNAMLTVRPGEGVLYQGRTNFTWVESRPYTP